MVDMTMWSHHVGEQVVDFASGSRNRGGIHLNSGDIQNYPVQWHPVNSHGPYTLAAGLRYAWMA